jgi:hypothetical protein
MSVCLHFCNIAELYVWPHMCCSSYFLERMDFVAHLHISRQLVLLHQSYI